MIYHRWESKQIIQFLLSKRMNAHQFKIDAKKVVEMLLLEMFYFTMIFKLCVAAFRNDIYSTLRPKHSFIYCSGCVKCTSHEFPHSSAATAKMRYKARKKSHTIVLVFLSLNAIFRIWLYSLYIYGPIIGTHTRNKQTKAHLLRMLWLCACVRTHACVHFCVNVCNIKTHKHERQARISKISKSRYFNKKKTNDCQMILFREIEASHQNSVNCIILFMYYCLFFFFRKLNLQIETHCH